MTDYLLSNDDGVQAPGLAALAEEIARHGKIAVVAPESERSGFSHALTLDRPLRPVTLPNGFIAVNGTPVDCVHLALNGLLVSDPGMVISGINAGANLGDDVLYSGTVSAAMEGRFLGKPAMAVSLVGGYNAGHDIARFRVAASLVGELLQHWHELHLPSRTLLNVNVPDLPREQIRGFQVTRLGHRKRSGDVQKVQDPRGRSAYWIGVAGEAEDASPGTDFHAISEGFVSVTPLQTDLTRFPVFDTLARWLERF